MLQPSSHFGKDITNTVKSKLDDVKENKENPKKADKSNMPNILKSLKSIERVDIPPYFMCQQLFISSKLRSEVIDSVIRLHYHLQYKENALYLAISFIDRVLVVRIVEESNIKTLAIAALLIAHKLESNSNNKLKSLIPLLNSQINEKEILYMETFIINALEFRLTYPTIYNFIGVYSGQYNFSKHVVYFAEYLQLTAHYDTSHYKFKPSLIACSALYTSLLALNYPTNYGLFSEFDAKDIEECSKYLIKQINSIEESGRTCEASMKYATPKYMHVSRIPLQALISVIGI
jgi:transcription initiation factor TFIIIB Brf1 subunit/transcription initiation factor TFIIB